MKLQKSAAKTTERTAGKRLASRRGYRHPAWGLNRRFSPNVLSGQWPGMKAVSSPMCQGRSRMFETDTQPAQAPRARCEAQAQPTSVVGADIVQPVHKQAGGSGFPCGNRRRRCTGDHGRLRPPEPDPTCNATSSALAMRFHFRCCCAGRQRRAHGLSGEGPLLADRWLVPWQLRCVFLLIGNDLSTMSVFSTLASPVTSL